MAKYAEGTEVPIGRSRDEIERTLARFGASAQAWMRDDEKGVVTARAAARIAYQQAPSPAEAAYKEASDG
ncbi:MAG: hypothetical protein Q8O76_02985 [Chloroflexota bacterium]|nr:hypothetical protein [Chloroflexota bacterium]